MGSYERQLTGAACLTAIYDILSRTYPTYEEMDDPWMANGLSATPFRHLISGCLSTVTVTVTVTVTKRVVNAAVKLYQRVALLGCGLQATMCGPSFVVEATLSKLDRVQAIPRGAGDI